jgi:hypothetical protein
MTRTVELVKTRSFTRLFIGEGIGGLLLVYL